MDTVHYRSRPGDATDLLDGIRIAREVNVDPRTGPVVHRRHVRDHGDDWHADAPAAAESAEHLRRCRVRGHDDVRVDVGDHALEAGSTYPGQEGLCESPCGAEVREEPEPEIPEPLQAEEHDLASIGTDCRNGSPHRGEAVLCHDLDIRLLRDELCCQGACREIVALADARGHDQHALPHARGRASDYRPPRERCVRSVSIIQRGRAQIVHSGSRWRATRRPLDSGARIDRCSRSNPNAPALGCSSRPRPILPIWLGRDRARRIRPGTRSQRDCAERPPPSPRHSHGHPALERPEYTRPVAMPITVRCTPTVLYASARPRRTIA